MHFLCIGTCVLCTQRVRGTAVHNTHCIITLRWNKRLSEFFKPNSFLFFFFCQFCSRLFSCISVPSSNAVHPTLNAHNTTSLVLYGTHMYSICDTSLHASVPLAGELWQCACMRYMDFHTHSDRVSLEINQFFVGWTLKFSLCSTSDEIPARLSFSSENTFSSIRYDWCNCSFWIWFSAVQLNWIEKFYWERFFFMSFKKKFLCCSEFVQFSAIQ